MMSLCSMCNLTKLPLASTDRETIESQLRVWSSWPSPLSSSGIPRDVTQFYMLPSDQRSSAEMPYLNLESWYARIYKYFILHQNIEFSFSTQKQVIKHNYKMHDTNTAEIMYHTNRKFVIERKLTRDSKIIELSTWRSIILDLNLPQAIISSPTLLNLIYHSFTIYYKYFVTLHSPFSTHSHISLREIWGEGRLGGMKWLRGTWPIYRLSGWVSMKLTMIFHMMSNGRWCIRCYITWKW